MQEAVCQLTISNGLALTSAGSRTPLSELLLGEVERARISSTATILSRSSPCLAFRNVSHRQPCALQWVEDYFMDEWEKRQEDEKNSRFFIMPRTR